MKPIPSNLRHWQQRLAAAAPAQRLILDLLRYGAATVADGEFAFAGVMYGFDDHRPDWVALVDAIGWDAARAAIHAIEAEKLFGDAPSPERK
jgi:hypothetical protein